MKTYRVLLLDADNTILDFDRNEEASLRRTFEEHALPTDEEFLNQYRRYNESLWRRLEHGEFDMATLEKIRFEGFLKETGYPRDPKAISDDLLYALGQYGYLMEGAAEFCETLSKKYMLVVASNGYYNMQENRLRLGGILPYISRIYTSFEIGYSKPDIRFFEYILKDLDVRREEVLMVGDSLTSDILGATSAGIDTAYVKKNPVWNPDLVIPDYVYTSLKDLMVDL